MGKIRQSRRCLIADYNALQKYWTQACTELENCTDDDKRQELLKIKNKCEQGGKVAHETLWLMALNRRFNWTMVLALVCFCASIGFMVSAIYHVDFSNTDSMMTALKHGCINLGMLGMGYVCLTKAKNYARKMKEITK